MTDDTGVQELKQEVAETKSRAKIGTFSALAYDSYRYLWLGTLFSAGGQWVQQITVSWVVYDMTQSPLMLGLVNGLRAIPFLICSPLGGVAADRMDRKKLMMISQAVMAITAVIMAFLLQTGLAEVWHVFVFTFVSGVAWSFNAPVRQSLVPNVVPDEVLMNAVALSSTAFNIMQIVGPAIGGFLIDLAGVPGNFYIQGIAYLGVMGMIFLMKVPPNTGSAKDSSVINNLAEGFRYVWSHEVLRAIMVIALVPIIFASPYATLMPIFAQDILNVGPEGLGLLMAAPGIGALVGTLTLASLGDFRSRGPLLVSSAIAMGIFLVLFGYSHWFALSLAFLTGVGGTQIAYVATNNTILQMTTSDEFRGRVMSIYLLNQGLSPFGSLIAGALADFEGASFTEEAMGLLVLVFVMLILFKMPQVRRFR